ncbi:MAG: hypothetical protein KDA45_02545, partial [Planctomycetales bacterium]|nr:hypothetical protein [Planctomycetales bacterium]
MTVGHASPQVKTRVACSGRPAHAGVRRRGDWSLRGGCLLLWIVCGPWCGRPLWGQESDAAVACELRVVWGGPTSRSYEGLIAIDRGSVQPLRNLSLQSDSIGTIRGEDAQTLAIHPHSPSGFGGVDIAVRGSLSSRLRLQMNDPFSPQTKQFDLRLGDLLQGSWMESLDQQGNRLAIERQVHDRLRVRWDSEQAIFDGGQTWQVQIAGYQTGLEAGAYVANLRFVSSTASAAEVQQKTLMVDDSGGFTPFNLDLQVPEGEGAYQLEIAIQRRTILKSLVSSGPLLVRRVDLVVAPQRPPPKIVGWRPLASIDPLRASKPGSLSWLSSLDMRSSLSVVDGLGMGGGLGVVDRLQPYNPLAGSLNQPLSHGRLETRTLTLPTAESGVANELPCLTLDGESWLALPLSGLTANVPHRLRVRVPTDRPMELLVSVQQANVAGEYPQLGLDSGVLVEQRQARADGPLAIHDVVFWPRGEKAYALLVNSVPQTQASVLDLQLEQAQMSPPGEPQDSREEDVQQQTLGSKRMIGLNLDKPLLADGVSASRERDPLTGRALESWSTWQQAATRVCQLMEQREANTLLLKGFADGGGVFPSKRLQPSPRFDSGTFFS